MGVVVKGDKVGGIVSEIADMLGNPAAGGKIFGLRWLSLLILPHRSKAKRLSNHEGIHFELP
jgi:hypothetical protein